MPTSKTNVEAGATVAPDQYYVTIDATGPYLVFGRPPIKQQFIMENKDGFSWVYKEGQDYSKDEEPIALCRCGESKNKPYCDGSHQHARWDPELTASKKPVLDGAEEVDGPTLILSDNPKYCAYARFCDAYGSVWKLTKMSGEEEARELAIREANHCPSGRLKEWDAETKKPFEPHYDPSIDIGEDPAIEASAGIWLRGGIPIQTPDGFTYQVRNREALCRCGQSSNKPFCDGTHASFKFNDGLPKEPKPNGKEF